MGHTAKPLPVKLIIGIIAHRPTDFPKAEAILKRRFGKIDLASGVIAFDYTDYYFPEMGKPLWRKFISFTKLIPPDDIAEIKSYTNRLEKKFSQKKKNLLCRKINLDPGYINAAKLVLATTKDYSHRIYLKKGIYAEVTLSYFNKKFNPWPWTYPDYQSKEYQGFFAKVRSVYLDQMRCLEA